MSSRVEARPPFRAETGSTGRAARARDLPAAAILAALGTDAESGSCPGCNGRLELHESASYGVSIRCLSPRCRVGRLAWAWPTFFLAELWNLSLGDARRRLLQAGVDLQRKQSRRSRNAAAVSRFNAAIRS